MAGSTERAINMALRVLGISEVERDFRKVGKAGEDAFEKVEKNANKSDKAMSEFTARLKRVAAEARKAFDSTDGIAEARAADPAGYIAARNKAILDRVAVEKRRMQEGLPDFTAMGGGVDAAGASLTRFLPIAAATATALGALKIFVLDAAEAWMEHEQALNAFEGELALGRTEVNASAAQIEDMAKRVSSATGQTETAVLQAAATLAKIPGMTRESLEQALLSASEFANKIGVEVPDAVERIAPVLQALGDRDMKALVEATKSLDYELAATILTLAEAGKTAEAQQALFDGLRASVGNDDSAGLTGATRRLSKAWDDMKLSLAEEFEGPAATGLNLLAGLLEKVSSWADTTAGRWANMLTVLSNPITMPIGLLKLFGGGKAKPNFDADTGYAAQFLAEEGRPGARATVRDFEKRYGSGGRRTRSRSGGRSGKSDAQREADKLQREAEQARNAADRVIESNDDVVASYQRRAAEAEEKVGLEGDALKAVERRQALDAVVRRINREEIEKEVAARKAAAAVADKQFDEAAATKAATDAVEAKSAALREAAERELDAADATAEFIKRQAQAKAILETIKTPIERLNDEVERAIESLRDGDITVDAFNRRMDQLAEGFADAAHEADKSAQAWEGFGHDVGRSLADIVLNGGSAMDILQRLIQLPLDRLLEQNLVNPVADFIDGLTGNNRDKNVADARAGLPDPAKILGSTAKVLDPAAQGAAVSLTQVQASGVAAAQALQAVAFSAGNPIDDLAAQTDQAAQAMGQLTPATAQFGSALSSVLAQLAGGSGGGGGGLLSSLLSIGVAAFSGGAAPQASLVGSVSGAIAENPGLFASGTDRLPVGKPFWVGENGRELMELTRGGGVRVHSNPQSHRMAGSGTTVFQNNQTIMVPERADPRRTGSGIARATQGALARANNKGLAMGPRFSRS